MKFIDCKTEEQRLSYIETCIEKDLILCPIEVDLVYSSHPSIDINMVKDMLEQRKSKQEIAMVLGITRQALNKYMWCHQLSSPKRTKSRAKFYAKAFTHIQEILALRKQGQTYVSIAKKLNLSRDTIAKICMDQGNHSKI